MGKGVEELEVYQRSLILGEKIYQVVKKWDWFDKNTIGIQIIRSVDSVAANISEGFGRYFYNDSRRFVYYSRGSLYETNTWLKKAYLRKLIDQEDYNKIENEIKTIGVKLNNYIKSIGNQNMNDYQ
jgi:four helix bundle protein